MSTYTEIKNLVVKSGSIVFGDPSYLGPTTTLNAPTPVSSRTIYLQDPGPNNADIILSRSLAGSQTINGQLIVDGGPLGIYRASNQLVLVSGASSATINVPSTGGDRIFTIPDVFLNTSFKLGIEKCHNITEATTLTAATSGQTFLIQNSGSAYSITLPAPQQGLNYKFYLLSSPNAAITITAGSALIVGSLLSSDGNAVSNGDITSAITNIILGTTAKTADNYYFFASGAQWYVSGQTTLNTSVTVS